MSRAWTLILALATLSSATAFVPSFRASQCSTCLAAKGFGGGGASTSKKGGKKGGKAKAGKVTKGISTVTRVPEDPSELCVCSSGKPYGECCKPVHDKGVAPSAEELLRARFSAYCYRLPTFLQETTYKFMKSNEDLVLGNAGQVNKATKAERTELLTYIDSYRFSDLKITETFPAPSEGQAEIAFTCMLKSRGVKDGKEEEGSTSEFLDKNEVVFSEKSTFQLMKNRGWAYVDGITDYEGTTLAEAFPRKNADGSEVKTVDELLEAQAEAKAKAKAELEKTLAEARAVKEAEAAARAAAKAAMSEADLAKKIEEEEAEMAAKQAQLAEQVEALKKEAEAKEAAKKAEEEQARIAAEEEQDAKELAAAEAAAAAEAKAAFDAAAKAKLERAQKAEAAEKAEAKRVAAEAEAKAEYLKKQEDEKAAAAAAGEKLKEAAAREAAVQAAAREAAEAKAAEVKAKAAEDEAARLKEEEAKKPKVDDSDGKGSLRSLLLGGKWTPKN